MSRKARLHLIVEIYFQEQAPPNSGMADYRRTPGCPFGKRDKHGHTPRHVLALRDRSAKFQGSCLVRRSLGRDPRLIPWSIRTIYRRSLYARGDRGPRWMSRTCRLETSRPFDPDANVGRAG